MDIHKLSAYRDLALAVLLVGLCIWGDAIVDWLDPGRIDRRVEYNESQQAITERTVCEAFGTCRESQE